MQQKRKWLVDLRGDRTQEDIATDAGISRVLYTLIETGARNPSVTTAKKIAAVLGFTWTLFFDDVCNE
jgi:putative transcriptional regulator